MSGTGQTLTPEKCPDGAITSFPLGITLTPSQSMYDQVNTPVTMDIQWTTRTTPPKFLDPLVNAGVIDEVDSGKTNQTTMRFNGISYLLNSVQITSQTHGSWILPVANQSRNYDDLILIFTTPNDIALVQTIMLVIPLIRVQVGGVDPLYLKGLADASVAGNFTLKDCMPTNPASTFVYYSTCLAGYTAKPKSESVYVFVSVEGLQVSLDLIKSIMEAAGFTSRFPPLKAPFLTRFTPGQKTVSNLDYTKYIMTTNYLLNPKDFKNTQQITREDSLDAYKCVPIDPDADILDGKIRVDMDTGQVLKDVVAERDALRKAAQVAAEKPADAMEPGKLEKQVSLGFGIGLAILVVVGLSYFLFRQYVPGAVEAGAAAAAATTAAAAKGPTSTGILPPEMAAVTARAAARAAGARGAAATDSLDKSDLIWFLLFMVVALAAGLPTFFYVGTAIATFSVVFGAAVIVGLFRLWMLSRA